MSTGTNVVTFGKHKGQPVEVLAADENYVQWLIQQPWFAERYQNLYNVVMHINTDVPQDSPVHNAVQMQISRQQFGAALAFLVSGVDRAFWDECYTGPEGLTFWSQPEVSGWDLSIEAGYQSEGYTTENIRYYGVWMRLPLDKPDGHYPKPILPTGVSLKDVIGSREHQRRSVGRATDGSLIFEWRQDAAMVQRGREGRIPLEDLKRCVSHSVNLPAREGYEWTLIEVREDARTGGETDAGILVEIKPEMGDDYPSVLRQMEKQAKRVEREGGVFVYYRAGFACPRRKVLYIQRYTGVGATLEEVKWFFRTKEITLITEEELEWYAAIDAPPLS